MPSFQDWLDSLSPASFAGVPFAVLSSEKTFGRRGQVHEYPFRDTPWIEDLGRMARLITIRGFLIADSAVYGGGDVLSQQEALIGAAESLGPFVLIHPTLGRLSVDKPTLTTVDDETANYIAFTLQVVEAGVRQFPSTATTTTQATQTAASTANTAAASDFTTAATPLLGQTGVAATAQSVTGDWTDQITGLAADATSLTNLASQLPGSFGRFFNGANLSGFGAAFQSIYSADTTVESLALDAAAVRGSLQTAASALVSAAGSLGSSGSNTPPATLAASAQALVAQLQSTAADPADAVRILADLAQAGPTNAAASTPIGSALGDLLRRAAVTALADASSTYQPSSYDDANAVRAQITGLLDNEIDIAGDEGDDASFNALRALRVAVVQDLTTRGASLAPLATFTFAANLPALALAQRIYQDPTRADDLLSQMGDVPNPLFCPQSFLALAD